MRLDDLRYALAVAEHGHVGRAALRLSVSQSALSKGVQRLEHELGLPLFVRGPQGMAPTAVGSVFLERARHVCTGFDEATQEARELQLGTVGTVRIGVSPIFAEPLVAPAFTRLLAERPGARMRLTVSLNDALLPSLRLGELDLALNALEDEAPDGLQQEPLFDDDLCVVLREGHPLLARRRLRFADLGQAGWALPGPEVLARRRVEARFAEMGAAAPDIVVHLDSSVTLAPATVRHSDLLTVMSRFSLGLPLARGLRALPLAGASWPRRVGIVSRRGAYLSPLAQRFMALLRERARRLHA